MKKDHQTGDEENQERKDSMDHSTIHKSSHSEQMPTHSSSLSKKKTDNWDGCHFVRTHDGNFQVIVNGKDGQRKAVSLFSGESANSCSF